MIIDSFHVILKLLWRKEISKTDLCLKYYAKFHGLLTRAWLEERDKTRDDNHTSISIRVFMEISQTCLISERLNAQFQGSEGQDLCPFFLSFINFFKTRDVFQSRK